MKQVNENKRPLWQLCLAVALVILITAIGLIMLYREHFSERFDQPVSTYEPIETMVPAITGPMRSTDGKLNLNVAGKEELMTLPGIGEAMAERIIAFRSQTPFKQVRDIKKVSGIGEKTFQLLQELVYVE